MRFPLHLFFVLLSSLFLVTQPQAQTVDTVVGYDEIPPPELAYEDILIDDFDIYHGSTVGFTRSENAGWCNSIENDQYISFRASPSGAGSVVFEIESLNCATGDGLEVGLYDIHNVPVDSCYSQEQQSYTFSNLTRGLVYYIRIDGSGGDDCGFTIQTISGISTRPAPPSAYLGNDTICSSGCLNAPTLEIITCSSGLYAYSASNDTTYYGEVLIDDSEELSVVSETNCLTSTGEWYADFTFTGSAPPYSLNGQLINASFGSIGPFASGDTVSVLLSGASSCTSPFITEVTADCISSTTSVKDLGFEIIQTSASVLQVTSPSRGWQLDLVDMLGREVFSTPLEQDANQIHVGDLLRGTYFIVVQNGKKRATEKWVKR